MCEWVLFSFDVLYSGELLEDTEQVRPARVCCLNRTHSSVHALLKLLTLWKNKSGSTRVYRSMKLVDTFRVLRERKIDRKEIFVAFRMQLQNRFCLSFCSNLLRHFYDCSSFSSERLPSSLFVWFSSVLFSFQLLRLLSVFNSFLFSFNNTRNTIRVWFIKRQNLSNKLSRFQLRWLKFKTVSLVLGHSGVKYHLELSRSKSQSQNSNLFKLWMLRRNIYGLKHSKCQPQNGLQNNLEEFALRYFFYDIDLADSKDQDFEEWKQKIIFYLCRYNFHF